jgi:hypothetical protein
MRKQLFFMVALLVPVLAHAGNPSTTLSVLITPAGGEPPGCNLGAHGPIRGRPFIAHGTVVADDGCLLNMTYPNVYTGPCGGQISVIDDAGVIDMRDNGHWNTVHLGIWQGDLVTAGGWGQTAGVDPLNVGVGNSCTYGIWGSGTGFDVRAYLDNAVAVTQRQGMYLHLTTACQNGFWNEVSTLMGQLATRYANDTNVFLAPASEPEGCRQSYATVGSQEQTIVNNVIRPVAPNTMVGLYNFAGLWSIGTNQSNLASAISNSPGVDMTKAYIGFHAYEGGPSQPSAAQLQAFLQEFLNLGATVLWDEGGDFNTDPTEPNAHTSISMGISWANPNGWPDSNTIVFWPKD